jgi:hypothetical protein
MTTTTDIALSCLGYAIVGSPIAMLAVFLWLALRERRPSPDPYAEPHGWGQD